MQQADEQFWRRIDDDILDLLDLLRARWPNFNSVPSIDNSVPSIEAIIQPLNQAYKASGKAADLMDRGHL
jgi:hypothetical protein